MAVVGSVITSNTRTVIMDIVHTYAAKYSVASVTMHYGGRHIHLRLLFACAYQFSHVHHLSQ